MTPLTVMRIEHLLLLCGYMCGLNSESHLKTLCGSVDGDSKGRKMGWWCPYHTAILEVKEIFAVVK